MHSSFPEIKSFTLLTLEVFTRKILWKLSHSTSNRTLNIHVISKFTLDYLYPSKEISRILSIRLCSNAGAWEFAIFIEIFGFKDTEN